MTTLVSPNNKSLTSQRLDPIGHLKCDQAAKKTQHRSNSRHSVPTRDRLANMVAFSSEGGATRLAYLFFLGLLSMLLITVFDDQALSLGQHFLQLEPRTKFHPAPPEPSENERSFTRRVRNATLPNNGIGEKARETIFMNNGSNLESPSSEQTETSNMRCNRTRPSSYPLRKSSPDTPAFIEEYVKWHAVQRRCLLDARCRTKPNILVSRCPIRGNCLGLGDRMRGVVFSFLMAVISKRVFFIDWPKVPYDVTLGMVPASVDWTLPPALRLDATWPYLRFSTNCDTPEGCEVTFPGPSGANTREPIPINFSQDNFEDKLGEHKVLSVYSRAGSGMLKMFGDNPHYEAFVKEYVSATASERTRQFLMQNLFRASPHTLRRMSESNFTRDSDYISVHLRIGGDVGEGQMERFREKNANRNEIELQMSRCVTRIRDCMGGLRRVFIASDSEEMRDRMQTRLQRKGFEVGSMNSRALHIDKAYRNTSMGVEERCHSYFAVFADLFMLADGKFLLGTGSHFMKMASMLGNAQGLTKFKMGADVEEICKPRAECGQK